MQREVLTEGVLSPVTYVFKAWSIKRNLGKMDLENDPKLDKAVKELVFNKRIMTIFIMNLVVTGTTAAVLSSVLANQSQKITDLTDSDEFKSIDPDDMEQLEANGEKLFEPIKKIYKATTASGVIMFINSVVVTFFTKFKANGPETKKAIATINSSIVDIEAQIKKVKDPDRKLQMEKRLTSIKVALNKLQ